MISFETIRKFIFDKSFGLFETVVASWLSQFIVLTDFNIFIDTIICFVVLFGVFLFSERIRRKD